MNTLVLVFASLVAVAYAAPQFNQQLPQQQPQQQQQQQQQLKKPIPIISMTDIRDNSGQFSTQYVSQDGGSRTEQGVLKMKPDGDYVLVQRGSYSYTSPEGVPVRIEYTADENGFNASGDTIPKGPIIETQ